MAQTPRELGDFERVGQFGPNQHFNRKTQYFSDEGTYKRYHPEYTITRYFK